MKFGYISEPNSKGQIVIPKKLRDDLGITQDTPLQIVQRGEGIYIYPIEGVETKYNTESSFAQILEKTRGTWAGDDWVKTEKKRRQIELKAARLRKRTW